MSETHANPESASESGVPLREHAFDGIHEFDNKLPQWWLWTFYIAIIFSVGYWLWAHGLGIAPTDHEVMQKDLEAIRLNAAGVEISEDGLESDAGDEAILASGAEIFANNCSTCHGATANGMINETVPGAGPNLTDEYWIHGGKALDIHATITNGVLEKGMLAWGPQLGPVKVRDVTAYVLSLRNTNVEGKEAQGEKFTPQ